MTLPSSNDICVFYFGKRGGGKVFTEDFIDDFPAELNREVWLSGSHTLNPNIKCKKLILETPRQLLSIKQWLVFTIGLLKIRYKLRRDKHTIIFTMIHPIDLLVHKILQKNRSNKFLWVIHDFELHPGDSWPGPKHVTKRIKRAEGLVFLSQHVYQLAKPTIPETTRVFLNPLVSKTRGHIETKSMISKPYALLIGRIKSYKGIDEFLSYWETIDIPGNLTLIIAGENANNIQLQGLINKDIEIIDRWLEDDEIWNLINNCTLVILPYTEASQSGIASIAIACGTASIYSQTGGLPEQLELVPNSFPFAWTSDSVENAIQSALLAGKTASKIESYKQLWKNIARDF
jgi:glycosyltransferase involved in cell wall biosynthesis